MKTLKNSLLFILALGMMSCGGKKFQKNPVDIITKDIPSDHVFSIILYDMDVEGSFFHKYNHQYRIIEEKTPGKPEERITDWYEVDKNFFERHANDMGMELASRDSTGKLVKSVSPPGYNNYVGNKRYGYWNNSGGNSFWAFYGQYAFMSSMFNMMSYPVRRSYYDNYRGSYYGTGRSYYGPTTGGRSYYGTNSNYTRSTRPNSVWSNNKSSFKQRVANRTSRSSSRYGSSSSRSRGGGFGK
ncbi:hypothetical protein FNH22_25410 [Fulvivirga sp. M361]|uniref:hypothetical protein n=1 Tax=Fulvivirga sp. M361 TaxID=2594266 RepID=UPI001179A79C|nr:hypothetical protein [Fulvivirga sp. M361]TRX50662.1 hypothetical protein FNH22_25410 [Fulvivirga sp. M361]